MVAEEKVKPLENERSNRFEKFTIKVKKDVNILLNFEIKFVNPTGTLWKNSFRTEITVTCDDIQVIANK